jgi:hypothetical protein
MRRIALALALALASAGAGAAPAAPDSALGAALAHLAAHNASYVDDLLDFVHIPGVSSLPERGPDLAASAAWVKARLERAGLENVRVLMAGRHPAVYADWLHAGPRKAVVLIYGHHDVQPASSDPSIEPWTTPPFDPVVRDGCVFGRGAQDDKGGLLGAVAGVEAYLRSAAGALPVNVKFLIEGQVREEWWRGAWVGRAQRRAPPRRRPSPPVSGRDRFPRPRPFPGNPLETPGSRRRSVGRRRAGAPWRRVAHARPARRGRV